MWTPRGSRGSVLCLYFLQLVMIGGRGGLPYLPFWREILCQSVLNEGNCARLPRAFTYNLYKSRYPPMKKMSISRFQYVSNSVTCVLILLAGALRGTRPTYILCYCLQVGLRAVEVWLYSEPGMNCGKMFSVGLFWFKKAMS
uniref:Uncharacterized protein n=1 Tax=Cacopsylla melanoneura TaxID=428564 RepID=A0A8D8XC37_9HEMI